jgi:hypothetical protein
VSNAIEQKEDSAGERPPVFKEKFPEQANEGVRTYPCHFPYSGDDGTLLLMKENAI